VDQKNPIESMIQTNPNWKKKRYLWFRSKTKPNQLKTEVVWFGSWIHFSDPMDKPNQTNI
jgi:hypothetical protein